jgi:signal recognition particle receptor subunit beta
MALLDFAHREITANVVYFGAAGAGVASNVENLSVSTPTSFRGPLHRFGARRGEEPALLFEYRLDYRDVRGFPVRVLVYGLPGRVASRRLRQEVLHEADGIVFVADARPEREQANVDTFIELEGRLRDHGIELATVPLVVQINHADSPNARPESAIIADLTTLTFQAVRAAADRGTGVRETHERLVTLLLDRLDGTLGGPSAPLRLRALRSSDPLGAEAALKAHARSLADEDHLPAFDATNSFSDLPVTERFSVAYQTGALRGTRPTHVLGVAVDGTDVVLDLVHERLHGGDPRRIHLVLENRPIDAQPVARLPEYAELADDDTDVTAALPDVVPIAAAPAPIDLPPVVYGGLGVVGGLVIGLLAGALWFL